MLYVLDDVLKFGTSFMMRSLSTSTWLLMLLTLSTSAQVDLSKHRIGLHQNFIQFDLGSKAQLNGFGSSAQMIRISHSYNLGKAWVVHSGLMSGRVDQVEVNDQLVTDHRMLGADANLWLKMNNGGLFPFESRLTPYLSLGYRYNVVLGLQNDNWLSFSTYGGGFDLAVTHHTSLQYQWSVHQQLNGSFKVNAEHRIGVVQRIRPRNTTDNELVEALEALERMAENHQLQDSLNNERMIVVQELADKQERLNAQFKSHFMRRDSIQKAIIDSLTHEVAMLKDSNNLLVKEDVSSEPTLYYVITISATFEEGAKVWLDGMKRYFPDAEIIPQTDGLYRVGVRAGNDLGQASSVLRKAIKSGYESAWIYTR